MYSQKLFSIIIPTRARWEYVSRLIKSIQSQKLYNKMVAEIIVAVDRDGGQKYRLPKICHDKKVVFILSPKRGVNSARNSGMRYAKSKYCIFFDDDIVLSDNLWLQRLYNFLSKHPGIAGCGGPFLPYGKMNLWGEIQFILDKAFFNTGFTSFPINYHLLGGNFIFNREILSEMGGFDEKINYGSAETELNIRCYNRGLPLLGDELLWVSHDYTTSNSFLKLVKKIWRRAKGASYIYKKSTIQIHVLAGEKNKCVFWQTFKEEVREKSFGRKILLFMFIHLFNAFYHISFVFNRVQKK